MNKLRKRLVNFRVTDQEFEQIKIASERQGARCISEFARSLMLGSLTGACEHDARNSCNSKLVSYDERLAQLEYHVSKLIDRLFESNDHAPILLPQAVNSAPEEPR